MRRGVDSTAGRLQGVWEEREERIWSLRGGNRQDVSRDIAATLLDQPPWLRPRYLYDEKGSRLFDRICRLPEYYLTRTEEGILARRSGEIIRTADCRCLVELGAGFSRKTRYLLAALLEGFGGGEFIPVDVSLTALRGSRQAVTRSFPQLSFCGLQASYLEGISALPREGRRLFAFLGSTVGNLGPVEFFQFFEGLSAAMGEGDYFLLGVDRVKQPALLQRAYQDSKGVTAEFILNAFRVINRLTGTAFDLSLLDYQPRYNGEWQQMEMYVRTSREQVIRFPSLGLEWVWSSREPVLVEISRKFDPLRLARQLTCFGLELVRHDSDRKHWFSLLLFRRSRGPEPAPGEGSG